MCESLGARLGLGLGLGLELERRGVGLGLGLELEPELGLIHGLEYTRLHFAMGIVGDVGEGSSSPSARMWMIGAGGTADDEGDDEGEHKVGDGGLEMLNDICVGVGVGVGSGVDGNIPESPRRRRFACP